MPKPIAYVEHAAAVLAHAVDLLNGGHKFTLVTSIDIQGGAARELGTLAVVAQDGSMVGYMSNGCIDRDIQLQALRVLQGDGPAKVIRYGEGSPNFDLKLPCGGALELLLDPAPDQATLRFALAGLRARTAVNISFEVPNASQPLTFSYAPQPLVALAGRGAVFRATAEVAHSAGFALALYSPDDTDLADLEHLPSLSSTLLTTPRMAVELELDPYAGFLTLFHDHEWEPAILCAALKTDARFIGSLGSRNTHALRKEALRQMGVSETDIDRLKGPIGLVPSLRQAPLIAVSAAAELAAAFPRSIFPAHAEN